MMTWNQRLYSAADTPSYWRTSSLTSCRSPPRACSVCLHDVTSSTFGLSIAEWRVLVVVARFGPITPSVVAERSDMDKVKVSRATASLVASGLLEQGPAPHDGRARLLRLTEKGQSLHDRIVPMSQALERQLASGLSDEEWKSLRHGLGRLQGHLRALDGNGTARRPAEARHPQTQAAED